MWDIIVSFYLICQQQHPSQVIIALPAGSHRCHPQDLSSAQYTQTLSGRILWLISWRLPLSSECSHTQVQGGSEPLSLHEGGVWQVHKAVTRLIGNKTLSFSSQSMWGWQREEELGRKKRKEEEEELMFVMEIWIFVVKIFSMKSFRMCWKVFIFIWHAAK